MGLAADKLELIEWLTNLDDNETISYLKIVKNSKESNSDWWDDLTEDQKQAIERGLKDIDAGHVTTHAEVKKKYGL
ncbi:MAG: hypothetical protein K9J30_10700 [Bacteroidales bacterium]|nr:hypothetical protein [Bacteroidales bacterium]